MPIKPARLLAAVVSISFKLACIALMILLPLLGVWVASSLAVFRNQSVIWAVGAGLLLFPLLPLCWEGIAHWRRSRKEKPRARVLTFLDRLILRTVVLNGLFIAGLLAANPQAGFKALSARGDWMLAGHEGPSASWVRKQLFQAADALEWLYNLSREDNPYRKYRKASDDRRPTPEPTPRPTGKQTPPPKPKGGGGSPGPAPDRPTAWPQPSAAQPAARSIPAAARGSAEAIGKHLAQAVPDPFQRARAIHDFVALNVVCDVAALRTRDRPSQDPATVLRTGKGVCAGYALLFQAIAEAAGLEAQYVVGDVRGEDGDIDGTSHAWNAVRIKKRWYLVDATWDAGSVDGDRFVEKLRTTYFLTPPEVFSLDHFPEDPAWQLRADPISRGEFIRQPMMRPGFYAQGFRLLAPRRSQVTVGRVAQLKVQNSRGLYLLGTHTPRGGKGKQECVVSGRKRITVTCPLPRQGSYEVKLFSSPVRYGTYGFVGKLLVNATGG